MDGWKSRWSWVRFVNSATAQWIAAARCSSSACEETSITQAASPPARICANSRWRSIASGVVRTTGRSSPPTTEVTVPISPVRIPPASSRSRTRKAVVVLPLVPVIPTVRSAAVGSPWKRAAAAAMATRTSPTTTCGTGRSSSWVTTRPAAPRATASGAKSWPSRVKPGTQKNSVPGSTRRLSNASPVISTSAGPSPRSSRRFMAGQSTGGSGRAPACAAPAPGPRRPATIRPG